MRLTPAGKFLLFVVGLAVLGYAAWMYRDRAPALLAPGLTPGSSTAAPPSGSPAATTPAAAPAAERRGVLASIRQTGVLRVGMEPEAPPLHFINARKQEDGFDFRLAGIVAEGLGAKRIQVVEADYE
jgi:ABC-type amino acid transport substrate-binding protein